MSLPSSQGCEGIVLLHVSSGWSLDCAGLAGCERPGKPSGVGLAECVPLAMCKLAIDPYSLRNPTHLRGGIVAKRLMSMLAYGWVERCSDVAGCGASSSSKDKCCCCFISAIILMFNEL